MIIRNEIYITKEEVDACEKVEKILNELCIRYCVRSDEIADIICEISRRKDFAKFYLEGTNDDVIVTYEQ